MKPTIQKIAIPGLTINARVWGPENGRRVLALHGWLDNAATFDLLAPLLENCRIVAIDFPGHGFSDHMPICTIYNHFERCIQIFQVADALGWDTFSILGHSMGGLIGLFATAILPQRIEKIVAIDTTPFFKVYELDYISAFRKYIHAANKSVHQHTIYSNREDAARKRLDAMPPFSMKLESAMTLTEGGMIPVTGGYAWTFDMRLLLPTLVVLTDDIIEEIIKNITSPVCVIIGNEGMVKIMQHYREKLEIIENIVIHEIPGGHHVHLDDPKSVATIASQFFT